MSNTAGYPIPADKDDEMYYDYNNSALVLTTKVDSNTIFRISNNDAEPIMTIENNGNVIWHEPHEAGDAADVFCDQIQIRIEDGAAIKQNRKEWEERILDAMIKHAEIEPLTPEVLTEVFRKCIMLDKLKGIK